MASFYVAALSDAEFAEMGDIGAVVISAGPVVASGDAALADIGGDDGSGDIIWPQVFAGAISLATGDTPPLTPLVSPAIPDIDVAADADINLPNMEAISNVRQTLEFCDAWGIYFRSATEHIRDALGRGEDIELSGTLERHDVINVMRNAAIPLVQLQGSLADILPDHYDRPSWTHVGIQVGSSGHLSRDIGVQTHMAVKPPPPARPAGIVVGDIDPPPPPLEAPPAAIPAKLPPFAVKAPPSVSLYDISWSSDRTDIPPVVRQQVRPPAPPVPQRHLDISQDIAPPAPVPQPLPVKAPPGFIPQAVAMKAPPLTPPLGADIPVQAPPSQQIAQDIPVKAPPDISPLPVKAPPSLPMKAPPQGIPVGRWRRPDVPRDIPQDIAASTPPSHAGPSAGADISFPSPAGPPLAADAVIPQVARQAPPPPGPPPGWVARQAPPPPPQRAPPGADIATQAIPPVPGTDIPVAPAGIPKALPGTSTRHGAWTSTTSGDVLEAIPNRQELRTLVTTLPSGTLPQVARDTHAGLDYDIPFCPPADLADIPTPSVVFNDAAIPNREIAGQLRYIAGIRGLQQASDIPPPKRSSEEGYYRWKYWVQWGIYLRRQPEIDEAHFARTFERRPVNYDRFVRTFGDGPHFVRPRQRNQPAGYKVLVWDLPEDISIDVIREELRHDGVDIERGTVHIGVNNNAQSGNGQCFITTPDRDCCEDIFGACWRWYFIREAENQRTGRVEARTFHVGIMFMKQVT